MIARRSWLGTYSANDRIKSETPQRLLPGWKIRAENVEMFRPTEIAIVRYRYRGARIPTPWSSPTTTAALAGPRELIHSV